MENRATVTPIVSRHSMQDWLWSNPFREWRHKWRITRKVMAHILGVSIGTVENWESGFGRPRPEHFAKVNTHGGVEIDWASKWKAWLKKKPQIESQNEKTA